MLLFGCRPEISVGETLAFFVGKDFKNAKGVDWHGDTEIE